MAESVECRVWGSELRGGDAFVAAERSVRPHLFHHLFVWVSGSVTQIFGPHVTKRATPKDHKACNSGGSALYCWVRVYAEALCASAPLLPPVLFGHRILETIEVSQGENMSLLGPIQSCISSSKF